MPVVTRQAPKRLYACFESSAQALDAAMRDRRRSHYSMVLAVPDRHDHFWDPRKNTVVAQKYNGEFEVRYPDYLDFTPRASPDRPDGAERAEEGGGSLAGASEGG